MNLQPPSFATSGEYHAASRQPRHWLGLLDAIAERHDLALDTKRVHPGEGGTYPTFLLGDVVVKFFGHLPNWRVAYTAEQAAMAVIAQDPTLRTPRVVASGELFASQAQTWPYLVTTRMPGLPWHKANLDTAAKRRVAEDLGSEIARYQVLHGAAVEAATQPALDLFDAASRSSLPRQLLPQLGDYLACQAEAGLETDKSFVHGDLMYRHVFVQRGRLAGVIDWGDAACIDPHYELVQIQLNLLDRDFSLLQALLEAAEWQPVQDFPHRCLIMALQRQAHGLVQHPSMDVFYKLPGWLGNANIPDLDTLAAALFGSG